MATQPESQTRLAFGPFELDEASARLFRGGHRVKLAEQPVQILAALVVRPGELVTREQLYERIWGKGTFVDFEHSLSAAVHKIRLALRDSAENPRYIETVPGRGYRFIGGVEHRSSVPLLAHKVRSDVPAAGPQEIKSRAPAHWRWWLIAAAIPELLALLFVSYRGLQPKPKITGKDTLVLADFANATGDSVFDGALRQGLEVQLQQSPFLSVISDERAARTMSLMGQAAGARITPELALQICRRTGSSAVLEGSIAALGSQYVLGLRARSCAGDVFADEQAQARRKEDVLGALSQIAGRFRKRIGESPTTINEHNTPLAEATTPSLDALKAYSASMDAAVAVGSPAAIPFLKRAIELDPNFAMAYAYMGRVYGDLGETLASAENTSKAYQLRSHSSDKEKFYITFTYHAQVTGNLEKARETGQLWQQIYPRDIGAYGPISGMVYQGLGEYEKSVAAARTAIKFDPYFTFGYVNLGYTQLFTDKLHDVAETLEQASARNLEIPELLLLRYLLAFLQGDTAEMDRSMVRAHGKPGAEDWLLQAEALRLARTGQLDQAQNLSRHAAALAQQIGNTERAAIYMSGVAIWQALYGNQSVARKAAKAALDLSKGRDVEFGAAFALALAGERSAAQFIASDLEKRLPDDTFVKFTYVPSLLALISLDRGQPAKAIQALEAALPYEKAAPGSEFIGLFGSLYPAYVRGRAYQAERRPAEAAREFQKIVDHRGLVSCDPIDSLARLELARSLRSSGDIEKSKGAYRSLFAIWRTADTGVPLPTQARAEYRRFQ